MLSCDQSKIKDDDETVLIWGFEKIYLEVCIMYTYTYIYISIFSFGLQTYTITIQWYAVSCRGVLIVKHLSVGYDNGFESNGFLYGIFFFIHFKFLKLTLEIIVYDNNEFDRHAEPNDLFYVK